MKSSPLIDFIRFHYRFCTGRIGFPKELKRKPDMESYKSNFKIFLNILHRKKLPAGMKSGAILKVTFEVRKMSIIQKKVIPLLSIPFFAGAPGFVSKSFMLDESNRVFRGFYEWESAKAAREYSSSYAMKFMKEISIPGSVRYEIFTGKDLAGRKINY